MATLEKIRSKSVFLIIVIGVALLAFIIGDALTNSRNILGDHTTVAKIGSTKIDYTDYQRQREELNNRYEEARRQNPAQMANFDMQLLPQMALDQLVQETVLNNAAEKAGIRSSANLLRYYMLENPNNQKVGELLQSLQAAGIAAQTPAQAYDIIFNPKRNGLTDAQVEPLQRAWLAAERDTEKQIRQMIYQRLLMGTVKSNELDRKALYEDYITTQNVDVAYLPFGQLSEKEYPVSEKELKAAYDKEKKLFAVDADTRDIAFVAVTVNPSKADQNACKKLADETVKYMTANPGALSKDLKKEGVSLSHHSLRAADITAGPVKDFVVNGNSGADSLSTASNVALVKIGMQGFTVVRKSAPTTAVDSIQLNIVSAVSEKAGDKVLAALNAGLAADSISSRYSSDSVAVQLNQWIPMFTAEGPTNAISNTQLDSLRNAGGKFVKLQAGPQGMLLVQLVKQNAPVTVYDFEEADYVLGPSDATMNAEREKLEKFITANNSAKKFQANAAKAGYNVQDFTVTASTPAIPRFQGMNQYYADSRQVMRWVMIDADEDAVSHIYESKNLTAPVLYVAAVKYKYDDYQPLASEEVKNYLTEKIRREKAGDKLAAKYQKNTQSLQSAAQAMRVNVNNVPQFRFGYNAGINDSGVTGKIAGTKDKKVILAKGMDGIYVYQVLGTSKEKFPYNEKMYDQQYNQLINMNWMNMLIGTNRIKNNIYKFEAGD